MPTPFSSRDLGRVFDALSLTRGRGLGLAGGVTVKLEGDAITGIVQDRHTPHKIRITPTLFGRRVVFDNQCGCGTRGCAHLAAAAFAALDQFPELRAPEQQTFLDTLVTAAPEKERQRLVFELSPADPPHACTVTTIMIGDRTGTIAPTTPRQIASDQSVEEKLRDLAYLLGDGTDSRVTVAPDLVSEALDALARCGHARWHAGGRRLMPGETRTLTAATAEALPPRSSVIVGDKGLWYVDATTGAVGRVRIQAPVAPPQPRYTPPPVARGPSAAPPRRRAEIPTITEQVIVERPVTPVLRLTRFPCPDERGRMQMLDALLLEALNGVDDGPQVLAAAFSQH